MQNNQKFYFVNILKFLWYLVKPTIKPAIIPQNAPGSVVSFQNIANRNTAHIGAQR